MKREYNFEFEGMDEKKIARAKLINEPISTKYATELCREIKGKNVKRVEAMLQNIYEHKEILPLRKYVKKVAHRAGQNGPTKAGRWPEKACQAFLELVRNVKANADYKGLDADKLRVVHAFASIGFRRTDHQAKGQISGKARKKKSTHVEIVVQEMAQ